MTTVGVRSFVTDGYLTSRDFKLSQACKLWGLMFSAAALLSPANRLCGVRSVVIFQRTPFLLLIDPLIFLANFPKIISISISGI